MRICWEGNTVLGIFRSPKENSGDHPLPRSRDRPDWIPCPWGRGLGPGELGPFLICFICSAEDVPRRLPFGRPACDTGRHRFPCHPCPPTPTPYARTLALSKHPPPPGLCPSFIIVSRWVEALFLVHSHETNVGVLMLQKLLNPGCPHCLTTTWVLNRTLVESAPVLAHLSWMGCPQRPGLDGTHPPWHRPKKNPCPRQFAKKNLT